METRKALVVGIDEYPNCPLHGCCNDSEAIKDLLSNHGNGDPNFAVWKKDNVATKGELKELIVKCFEGTADVALFYYSGHGHIDRIGGYLVTPDYTKNDYGVSLHEVLTIANDSKCKERIIILDSCYSGIMGSINTSGQNTTVINEGVTIMTSSRNSQTSVEIDGHGVFTSLLLEALKGGAADVTGHISIAGVYAFIDKALGPWDQRPVFKTNVSSFTSLRDVQTQVDVSVLRKLTDYFATEQDLYELNPSYEPTNQPAVEHILVEPYANEKNIAIFSDLQRLESIGLVVPVNEEHMYFAAMKSKPCKLTPIGKRYWKLVKEGRI